MRWRSGRRWRGAEVPGEATGVGRDMSIALAEFLAHLPYALRGLPAWEPLADGARAVLPEGGRVTITAAPAPPRRLSGLLTLPRCTVTLSFADCSAPAAAAFVAAFDRAYQRGGG